MATNGIIRVLGPLGFCLCSLVMAVFLQSCDFFQMKPFKVESHSPASAVVSSSSLPSTQIVLVFSAPADRLLVEKAFSLSSESTEYSGTFFWSDDKTVVFTPTPTLQPLGRYIISLTVDASDTKGNSLARPFSFEFSDSSDLARPAVLSTIPADGTRVGAALAPLQFSFSEPMRPEDILSAFSLQPSVPGAISWNTSQDSFTFTPSVEYDYQTEYTATIRSSARDLAGNALASDFKLRFIVGLENIEPGILQLTMVDLVPKLINPGLLVNSGIESNAVFEFTCSEAVDTKQFQSLISFDPVLSFSLANPEVLFSDTIRITTEQRFNYGNSYRLQVADGYRDAAGNKGKGNSYFLLVNGPQTMPPRVDFDGGVGFSVTKNVTLSPALSVLFADDTIPFAGYDAAGPSTSPDDIGVFDIYLDLASVPLLASEKLRLATNVLQELSISATNSAVSISIDGAVAYISGDPISPAPGRPIGLGQTLVRVFARIIDHPSNNGLLTILLSDDFEDFEGNPASGNQTLQLKVISPL